MAGQMDPSTLSIKTKTSKILIFLFILLTTWASASQAQWQLVWSDEFDGGIGPDWVFETGRGESGWGNNELQYYRAENASVENGALRIQARLESYGGASYTSARMKTQGQASWKYGRIEARIAMPRFMGVWPAFWMLGDSISSEGWPACGEIDIMEHINDENMAYGAVHWDDNGQADYSSGTSATVTDYHVYAIEWDDQYIRWFLDDAQFLEFYIGDGINGTEEFHDPAFIILNMAIGGNWPGFTIDESALPANMYVDYVRVYQHTEDTSDTGSLTIEAEDYYDMSGIQTESCAEGGLNVGYIDTGDWMAYSNITIPESGTYTVSYRVAALEGGGRLSLDLNAGSIVLGELDIPATGGWQNWTTVRHSVVIDAGTYNVGIYAQQGGWNINWFSISR